MYGLLVENLASFIRIQWGEGKWDMVRKHTGVDAPSFSIHHVYPETLLNKLAKSAFQVLGCDEKQFYEAMGIYFIEYVGQYGYDKMLTVLGRHMRDFLNGLDNLHEYLKFSYTKMRAPSFFIDSETATGLRLHYRSRRRGFVYYVIGQIKQVARHFYNQDCGIEILSEELDGETMHIIFQLTFDNEAFSEAESIKSMIRMEQQLPIRASIIFELFPFCIVFTPDMEIRFTGHALLTILRDLVGQCMTEAFEMVKPLISFCFTTILERRNNIFELITAAPIKDDEALTGSFENESEDETGTSLKLRGQMMHMEEWNMMLFLANPVMPDLTSLVDAGLFINDLSLHDCSRDLVLAGTQQSVELKLALDQEMQKSKKLEESMKKLDEEMRKTDELLYQMIPKQVADRIRQGESPVDTCEVFESVSILFSDVVTFTDICSRITPMQVVCMLNHMYSLFDQLTERNGVYKVETIGDSYMVVSGAPNQDASHSERICDMAMDMVDATQAIEDPSRDGEHLKIRVGCHSASRMESTSEGGRVQISEKCMERLPVMYQTEKRGVVTVKGKGEMATYWLTGRENRVPLSKKNTKSFNWTAPVPSAAAMLKTQISKQGSMASEDGKPSPAELVKDQGVKAAEIDIKEKNKFVRQKSAIDASSLASSSIFKNEPKSSFNKPVETRAETVQVNNKSMFKPIMENISAFARQNTIAAIDANPPTKNEISPPVQKSKEVKQDTSEIVDSTNPTINPNPVKPKLSETSSSTSFIRTISPNPDLAPWSNIALKKKDSRSTSPTNLGEPKESKSLGLSPDNSGGTVSRRPSTPRVSETASGTKIIEWVKEPDPQVRPPQPAIPAISIPNGLEGDNLQQPSEPDTDVSPDENNIQINGPQLLVPESAERTDETNFERRKSRVFEGINGIRNGSREWRNKIRDKNLSTVTVEAMTDMGCNDFAAKQKEIISRACVLL